MKYLTTMVALLIATVFAMGCGGAEAVAEHEMIVEHHSIVKNGPILIEKQEINFEDIQAMAHDNHHAEVGNGLPSRYIRDAVDNARDNAMRRLSEYRKTAYIKKVTELTTKANLRGYLPIDAVATKTFTESRSATMFHRVRELRRRIKREVRKEGFVWTDYYTVEVVMEAPEVTDEEIRQGLNETRQDLKEEWERTRDKFKRDEIKKNLEFIDQLMADDLRSK